MDFKIFQEKIEATDTTLVAVSKTHGPQRIQNIYDLGQRDFGENKVQEMLEKKKVLPDDIRWHMIGHLQSNKVKYIVPFIHLIHSLDRISLAKEINRQARIAERDVSVLLQIKIAKEDSKFGINPNDIEQFMQSYLNKNYNNIRIRGVMGMATFTDDETQIRKEFELLERIFAQLKNQYFPTDESFRIKSYGMSDDHELAIETGSNMVRVGSLIFGQRNYTNYPS